MVSTKTIIGWAQTKTYGCSIGISVRYESESEPKLEHIVTGDETWVYHFTTPPWWKNNLWCGRLRTKGRQWNSKVYNQLGRWCALFFGTGKGLFMRNISRTRQNRRTPSPQIGISILLFASIRQSRGRDRGRCPEAWFFFTTKPSPRTASLVIELLNDYGWY